MPDEERMLAPYDRRAAVAYAHAWAYGRNPAFYDYEQIGGDCTNFASQCVYAGSGVMNFTQTYGWFYIDANNKSPAWTGVEYFYNFMTRSEASQGTVAVETDISRITDQFYADPAPLPGPVLGSLRPSCPRDIVF